MKVFRIDDIGASTKWYNQHGKKRVRLFGCIPFYFPFANVWFFKRIEPFRGWAPYNEVTAQEWIGFLTLFAQKGIVPIIAITATWVDETGKLIPFSEKFPEQAAVLKQALQKGQIMIANHGLTHCVVGKHLPRFWSSNRAYQREFLPELPEKTHREHIMRAQEILETFFERPITILVPPGNMWSIKTYHALEGTNIDTVMCNRYMIDATTEMEGVTFVPDDATMVVCHDRELKLYGESWLSKKIDELLQ